MNYGITEDMFSSFMHLISQWIRFKYSNYNTRKIFVKLIILKKIPKYLNEFN